VYNIELSPIGRGTMMDFYVHCFFPRLSLALHWHWGRSM